MGIDPSGCLRASNKDPRDLGLITCSYSNSYTAIVYNDCAPSLKSVSK